MKKLRVEVVCVGTELLTGRINTHASYLGVKLADIGLSIAREHTVPDDETLMEETFRDAYRRADVILSCGGLGPTFDDVTRDVWARVCRRPLQKSAALERNIREKFRARRLPMPPANLRQALLLRGAAPISNANGTAPGQFLKVGRKVLVLLPGPARELYPMFESVVRPRLARLSGQRLSRLKTFLIAGVPESRVDEIIRPLVARYARVDACQVIHGILASNSLITVKFRVEGTNPSRVAAVQRRVAAAFRTALGAMVIGEDEDRIENVVGDRLRQQRKTVAVAESCTGGLVSKMLTDRPGSSAYMMGGAVTYSNALKTQLLGVSARLLQRGGPGAVSEVVARRMAEGIRRRSGADIGLATTGIAGPSRDDTRKPVGLVFIACATKEVTMAKKFNFIGDRDWIRQRTAVMALDLLRQVLAAHAL